MEALDYLLLSFVAFVIIVNGEPKEWFKGQQRVRQGDPLLSSCLPL